MASSPGPQTNTTGIRITSPIRKSTVRATTEARGTRSRGKYTLVTMFETVTRLSLPWLTLWANRIHSSSPAMANRAYGTPSDGTPTSRPKMSVKIRAVNTGCSTDHVTPSAVCL